MNISFTMRKPDEGTKRYYFIETIYGFHPLDIPIQFPKTDKTSIKHRVTTLAYLVWCILEANDAQVGFEEKSWFVTIHDVWEHSEERIYDISIFEDSASPDDSFAVLESKRVGVILSFDEESWMYRIKMNACLDVINNTESVEPFGEAIHNMKLPQYLFK